MSTDSKEDIKSEEVTRTLHMYADGFSKHKFLDSDKKTVVYRMEHNPPDSNKPNIEVYRRSPDSGKDVLVGSVSETRGSFGLKFDVQLGEHHFVVQPPAFNNPSWTYHSPRLGIGVVAWEEEEDSSRSTKMVERRTKKVVARIQNVAWAWSKVLRMQLYGTPTQEEQDEMIVTGSATWLSQVSGRRGSASSAPGLQAAPGVGVAAV